MKILFINTSLSGGAARGARFLFEKIRKIQGNSLFLYKKGKEILPPCYIKYSRFDLLQFIPSKKIRRLLKNLMSPKAVMNFEKNFVRDDAFSLFSPPATSIRSLSTMNADIIHLNWIARFFDYESFFSGIKEEQKIVWTLRDMNPFTGGCHCSTDISSEWCDQYYNGCQKCVQLRKSGMSGDIKHIFEEKMKAISKIDEQSLVVVGPSEWVCEESKKSRLLGRFRHKFIPHGIDTEIFQNREQNDCRRKIGVQTKKKIVLFVSYSIENRTKGIHYLLNALKMIDRRDILLLSVGKGKIDVPSNIHYRHLGFFSSREELSYIYNCADFFVTPSVMESFGFTIAESLCCGVPVVGFDTSGVTEKIFHGRNGYLAENANSSDLKQAMEEMLDRGVSYDSKQISEMAREEYSAKKMVMRYYSLYKELLR